MADRDFRLEPQAMAVLVYLARRSGRVVSKRELFEQVWEGRAVSDDALTVSIYGLRKILGDSARDPRFIATVPRQGYRWIGPISDRPAATGAVADSPSGRVDLGGGSRFGAPRLRAQASAMAVAGLIVASFAMAFNLDRCALGRVGTADPERVGTAATGTQARAVAGEASVGSQTKHPVSLAVLPFADLSRQADNAFLAEGLSAELVDLLVRTGAMQIAGRTSSLAAQKAGWTIPQIGRQLGVHYVLEGSVQRDEQQLRVTVQLSDAADGFHIWSERYAWELPNSLELQSEIALAIAESLDVELPSETLHRGSRRIDGGFEAYEAYLRGRYHWHQGGQRQLQQAAAYFERAIEIDPHYAAAYSGLADTYLLLPVFTRGSRRTYLERAQAAADRALALDPLLAESQASRAEVRLRLDHDVAGAEQGLRRALALNARYASAHHRLGNLLFSRQGRLQEALDHIRQAERLDPLNLIYKQALGHFLLQSGAAREARSKFLEAAAADATSPGPLWGLARCAFTQRRYGEAARILEKLRQLERDGGEGFFRLGQFETLTIARHLAGDHERELADALAAQRAAPGSPWAIQMEARARVASGEAVTVRAMVDRLLADPDLTGQRAHWWLRLVAELRVHGEQEAARWTAARLADRFAPQVELGGSEGDRLMRSVALAFWLSDQPEAAQVLVEAILRSLDAGDRDASDPVFLGEVGSLAARVGDRATAERLFRRLGDLERRGEALFWQAAIAAALGEGTRAVDLLEQALEHGFVDLAAIHSGPYFISLHDHRSFHQLTLPRHADGHEHSSTASGLSL
ncbi:MAG: winged helix-turn-helix domain-containing protein [Acidobacteriota bacterium]